MEPHSAPRVGERYTQRDGERHMHRNAECSGGLRQQAPAPAAEVTPRASTPALPPVIPA